MALVIFMIAAPALVGLGSLLLPATSRGRFPAAAFGITASALSLLTAVTLLATAREPIVASAEWITIGDLTVRLGLRADLTAIQVSVAVTAVALAVQVYSLGYLHRDERYAPYAAQVSLFTAAMLLVVTADDLILLLIGWEVMGACSYLLIGHDRTLPEAPAAAVKAFLVTRVGDVGFLLGIAFLAVHAGTFGIPEILAGTYPGWIALLLLAGVAGKSAQVPLHTWLPDAMAGPTPVSALIHAATMVASGVYVVARLYPVFVQSPLALSVLGLIAAVTLLLGALAATAQEDIKRVLAWSTVSQIGYMAAALAIGAPGAAIFHLLTHAAFKALLFLAAGCVIHAVGSNLMSRMGGLRKNMPDVFWCTAIGLGALAGLPPLAGFWSKESVIAAAAEARDGHGQVPAWIALVIWVVALLGVALTAWYSTRLLLRVFFGPVPAARAEAAEHPPAPEPSVTPAFVGKPTYLELEAARKAKALARKEVQEAAETAEPPPPSEPRPLDPPALMHWPVMALAVPSALLGLIALLPDARADLGLAAPHVSPSLFLALALLAAGAISAWWLWRRRPDADPASALGPLRPVLAHAFHLDDLQHHAVVRPARAIAAALRRVDESVVDGAVEGAGRGTTGLGGLLARAHRAPLPRAATALLAGVLLIGLAAAILGGGA
ncbi:NADH-quinone oxidoreductase subunit 5 family protein [Catenuloplanes atrovinosus]|uniref:NADH-quinone oxidoreductase subunit L n=1 Tax=Catenuloplanes atrovinosus TaxID=137266 RepID=A0AAE4CCU1_9ACTN|nr:NADH-quinone oxidoreductase subunit L [Catenuloplanes atrovinosus]MDR7279508.1 NADH-quinone oxidoreductase subunit L [Catenuloplanes atrovinosus]